MKRLPWNIFMTLMVFYHAEVLAWNDTQTHPHITIKALEYSSLDKYLKNQLKFPLGSETILGARPVQKWLQYGAEMEDNPACRASNHFHNPYLSWEAAGLTDTWWLVDLWCWATSPALVKVVDNQAEYNLVGQQSGQDFSFYLVFEKDGQGIWHIKFF